jgi:hypothetical protein
MNAHGSMSVILGQFRYTIDSAHLSSDTKVDALAFARALMLVILKIVDISSLAYEFGTMISRNTYCSRRPSRTLKA